MQVAMVDGLVLTDVPALVGLLAEVANIDGSLAARRHRLLAGLGQLFQATGWYWVVATGASPSDTPAALAFLSDGWASEEQRVRIVGSHFSAAAGPINDYFQQRFTQHFAATRSDIVSDDTWYASALYQEYHQPVGVDDFMAANYHVRDTVISCIGYYRTPAAGRFTRREAALLHLVTGQVKWLHATPTDLPATSTVPALSPRLREVLLHLLAGDSRKQIARKLRLSEHTVSDYIKALHRNFGVSSRGELMAQFLATAAPVAAPPAARDAP